MIVGLGVGAFFNNGRGVSKKIVDYFSRTSTTSLGTSDSGHIWNSVSGTWGTNGSRIYNVSDVSGQLAIINSSFTNFKLSVILNGQIVATNGHSRFLNLVFHYLDENNYLFTRVTANNLELYKLVGGTLTKIAQVSNTTTAIVDGIDHLITVECNEINIAISLNGTKLIDHYLVGSDATTFPSYTKVGFRLTKSGSPSISATADNFILTELDEKLIYVKDSFISDENVTLITSADTGQTWSANGLKKNNGYAFADTWTVSRINAIVNNNFEISCDVTRGVNTACSIGFRCSTTNDADRMEFVVAPNALEFNKKVNFAVTKLASYNRVWTANETIKLKCVVISSNIKCYCDDVLIFDLTDSDLLNRNYVGIFPNNNPLNKYDNFVVKEV